MNTEIITLVIVLVLLYTRPSALVRFSNTLLGKVLFVSAIIIASLVNPLAGLFFATLMIVLMEQSYEGFKEGLDDLVTPISVQTVGTYVQNTDMITVKSDDSGLLDKIPVNRTIIKYETDDTVFDEHTVIKAATGSVTITLDNAIEEAIDPGTELIIVTGIDDSVTKAETGHYIKYQRDLKDIVRKVASINENEITFENGDKLTLNDIPNYEVVNTVSVKSDTKKYEPTSDEPTVFTINTDIDTDKIFNTIDHSLSDSSSESSLVIPNTNELASIKSVEKTINLTISTGIKSVNGLGNNKTLTIENHSHTHGHDDNESFVGGRREGFFAGDSKKETAVKGAYAEETYEDEIVGETVCSSDLCDRIDSEFKLIRPINSNDHTPTNV
tara:strand:+ start:2327 stop:3481 length:1155 start_codon:yes stop_codon:yes gene_type:complete